MKHIKSYQLFESVGMKTELHELVKNWVLGNEESLRFLPEHGDRLLELIDQNPRFREESRRHLVRSGVAQLWRGLHEEWDEEYEDQLESRFSSYSSSREVANGFGSGDLLSIPAKKALDSMLLSIEWCAGWLGVEPFTDEEMMEFTEELNSGGISDRVGDPDERWFRYMAWEQKEYLILNEATGATTE